VNEWLAGQPDVGKDVSEKDVSERVIGMNVRVIVNADGFVTITTALPILLPGMSGVKDFEERS
jgi:hypothetical protein